MALYTKKTWAGTSEQHCEVESFFVQWISSEMFEILHRKTSEVWEARAEEAKNIIDLPRQLVYCSFWAMLQLLSRLTHVTSSIQTSTNTQSHRRRGKFASLPEKKKSKNNKKKKSFAIFMSFSHFSRILHVHFVNVECIRVWFECSIHVHVDYSVFAPSPFPKSKKRGPFVKKTTKNTLERERQRHPRGRGVWERLSKGRVRGVRWRG